MSGGIAYILDPKREFHAKCNKESVDLLPLEKEEDIIFMKKTLAEFKRETGSEVASRILDNFEVMKTCFVKVFPLEYQRALIELEAERQKIEETTPTDTETTTAPVSNETENEKNKQAENSEEKKESKCKDVADIEDSVTNVEMKKRKMEVLQNYDKIRGFVKYERENKPYRAPKSRQNDWDEIFDFKHVRKGKNF